MNGNLIDNNCVKVKQNVTFTQQKYPTCQYLNLIRK